ncbi:MAG: GDSL-type esterase/lipase family protein [Bauldia litoralis]
MRIPKVFLSIPVRGTRVSLAAIACLALWLAVAAGPAMAKTISIVALGDSNTYGYGIKRPGTYPSQLEILLQARGYDVDIVNRGVSGDTTFDALGRLEKAVPEGTDALILFLGRNDWRRNTPPSAISHNLEIIIGQMRQRGIPVLLVGFKPHDFSDVAEKYGVLYYPDFFDGTMVLNRKLRKYRLGGGDIAGHLNADGYAVVANRMLPSVEQLIAQVSD